MLFLGLANGLLARDLSRNVAGEKHFPTDRIRNRILPYRIVKLPITVNPYLIIKLLHDPINTLFLPVLLYDGSLIHDVPQAKDSARPGKAPPEPLEGGQDLFLQAEGFFVHNEEVGLEGFGRCFDDIFTDIKGMFRIDFDGEGEIFLICLFDHARYPNKVDLVRHGKPAHDGGSRQDEDVDINGPQMRGDSHGAAYMPETIGVMGIHEDVIVRFDSSAHLLKYKKDFLAFSPPVLGETEISPCYRSLPIDASPAFGRPVGVNRNLNQTSNIFAERLMITYKSMILRRQKVEDYW